MAFDHTGRQLASHLIELGAADAVLESGNRRLRRQRRAVDRIAVEQQLLNRIVGQPVGVVRIGIPAGDAEDCLRKSIY